jgi:DNA-binding protein
MNDDKPTDAEEIFSEFQKKKSEQEKPAETPSEPAPEPIPQPEPQPEPEPIPQPEPQPEPEPIPEPEPQPEPETQPSETSESKTDASDTSDDDKERIRDVIFVGIKPIMTYVTATLTQLSNQKTVTIKARGKRITQAVDVSQMIVKRMDSVGYIVSDVRIASDSLTSQDGRLRNVSTIEIDVTKP